MNVYSFQNELFTSNAYLIHGDGGDKSILVDIGEYDSLRAFIVDNRLRVVGLFLTHAHYDHIFYINELMSDFPQCRLYAHPYTILALADEKVNLSFYRELPISYRSDNHYEIIQDETITLDWLEVLAFVTPGHNQGSISFKIGNYLFTGDSLIPGHQTVTKLKSGNKIENLKSLSKLGDLISDNTYIAPGHGPIILGEEYNKTTKNKKIPNLNI